MTIPTHLSVFHLLLLVQNLSSSKQIASTDNMLSKLHDGYTPFISGQRFHMQTWIPYCSSCTLLLNKAHLGSFIDFQLLFLTLILSLCLSSLSLPSLLPSLSLPLPSPTRYSDCKHPQRQLTLWAIFWSIPPPLASTLWRCVLTHFLVSFDNLGHGCPMAKSSHHCSTLPNKVGVVGKL